MSSGRRGQFEAHFHETVRFSICFWQKKRWNRDKKCCEKEKMWILLTRELRAFKTSSDISFNTMLVGGRRCIRAFATRLLPDPPCRHRPNIICVVCVSKLSNGSLEMRLVSMRRLSSNTSGCRSVVNRVWSKESKWGWMVRRLSDDFNISSIVHIAFERRRQSCEKMGTKIERIYVWLWMSTYKSASISALVQFLSFSSQILLSPSMLVYAPSLLPPPPPHPTLRSTWPKNEFTAIHPLFIAPKNIGLKTCDEQCI